MGRLVYRENIGYRLWAMGYGLWAKGCGVLFLFIEVSFLMEWPILVKKGSIRSFVTDNTWNGNSINRTVDVLQ